MTTLYKPVLIETAEQAEALPALTPYVRVYYNEVAGEVHPITTHAGLVGDAEPQNFIFGPPFREFTLVPIEAEELSVATSNGVAYTRFITPWEAAS